MKKTVLAILMAMVATSAFAEAKCEGGTPFEGVIDEHEYCISKVDLTWWAAFAWCRQQGRHLASLQEACEGWQGATVNAACGNLIKSGVKNKTCWTATPSGSSYAYSVTAGTGTIANGSRRNPNYALCY